ncbi:MAG: ABC transporter substrate-binding protein [Rhodospirillales bacterium]
MTFKLNRREALAAGAAAGAAASIAAAGPAEAAPKKGGHLRVGLSGGNTVDNMDGATHTDIFMQMTGQGTVFDSLTEVAADGSLRGELAESWEASKDAKTWTFKLKKGVTFHNGKDFGADDVIESLQHHIKPDSTSAAKPIVEAIVDMKKMDKHTVRMTLKNGNADLSYMLSDYHILMYPAGMLEEAVAKGIGSGAYTNERFEPGVAFKGSKNPNDHRNDRGWFDSVEYININDPAARSNALVTKEVDVINKVDPKTAHLLARNADISLVEVTGNQHFTFPMHATVSPFDNNDVRLALKHGVNREELVQKVLRGHGSAGNDHPIGPANTYFDKGLEQRTYDPDKAKFHLKKAGMSSLNVDLSSAEAAFPGAVDAAVLYKEQASAAGININVIREPNDGYWSEVWLKKPFCACFWGGRATEDWMFQSTYASGVPWNDTYWEHERFNKLLIQGRSELDSGRRREIYGEMQKIVRDEGSVIIPMYANYISAKSGKLTHPNTVGNAWSMDGFRLAERWWFA